jgi:transcriptional regulator with XRE-family HTH domain
MQLKEYLYRKRLTQKKAADQIGITREYLNEIANKKEKPSPGLCEKIIKWSGKKITYSDLLDWDKEIIK